MKFLIHYFTIMLCLATSAAGQTQSASGGIRVQIDPKVSMLSPDGFVKASTFTGFQQLSTGSSIMFLNTPAPYAESIKGFTQDRLVSQGISVVTIEDVKLGDYTGKLVTADQNAQMLAYSKLLLCFGDDHNTYVVNGSFPKDFEGLHDKMRKALLSIRFNPDATPLQVQDSTFTIRLEGTKLKHATSTLALTSVYTHDGLIPTQSQDKTIFMVSQSFSEQNIADKEKFASMRLRQLPFKIDSVQAAVPLQIDKLPGYEIVATGSKKSNGSPLSIYQAILFDDKKYFLFIGQSEADSSENLALFRELTRSFQRR